MLRTLRPMCWQDSFHSDAPFLVLWVTIISLYVRMTSCLCAYTQKKDILSFSSYKATYSKRLGPHLTYYFKDGVTFIPLFPAPIGQK